MGGRPVGIVANQPRQLGGILDNDSADKAARFINLVNAYGLPLVYLMDVPRSPSAAHTGTTPWRFHGRSIRFPSAISSARMIVGRVSRGSITSSIMSFFAAR